MYVQAGYESITYNTRIEDIFKEISYFNLDIKVMKNLEDALMNTYNISTPKEIKTQLYINNHVLGLKGLKREPVVVNTNEEKNLGKLLKNLATLKYIKENGLNKI